MSEIENFRSIVIYSQNQEFEPHPLKFHANTHPDDVDHLVKETIENIKNHINNPNLKVWDSSREDEINYQNENMHNYASLILAEAKPGSSFGGSDIPLINHSPNRKRVEAQPKPEGVVENLAASSDANNTRRAEGPIVADKAERSSISLQPSTELVQQKRKSAAKIYIDGLNQNVKPNSISAIEPDHSRGQSVAVSQVNTDLKQSQNVISIEPVVTTTQRDAIVILNRDQIHPESNLTSGLVDNATIQGTGTLTQGQVSQNSHLPVQSINLEPQFSRVIALPPTGTIGTRNIDGNDPNIYSFKTSIMPFSYMVQAMEARFNEKLPPPVYLPNQLLCDKKQYSRSEVFHGLEITPIGELKLVDPEILQLQKGLISEVLQSLVKSLAEGRGFIGVSLPVRIFEPRSLIERLCDFWTFVPNYIVPAAQHTDPLERIKKLVTTLVSGMHLNAKQLKPFNPLLGETFQGVFPQHGISIDLEHTSHHPPIANYILKHKDFKLWGRYEFNVKLIGTLKNTVEMLQEGTQHLEFNDGHKLLFTCPYLHLEGLTHGARTARFCGVLKVVDEVNKIKALIKVGDPGDHKELPKKRTDVFHGKIFKYKDMNNMKDVDVKSKKKDPEFNFDDMESPICDVYGTWLEYLKIGGVETWNIQKDVPTPFFPVENPLPSDARFREDLIWMKRNNRKYAQEWKLILEVRQRHEKKLRMDAQKHSKKKH